MGEAFVFCFLIFFLFGFLFLFLSKALEIFLFIYDTPVCGSTEKQIYLFGCYDDEQGAVKVTSLQVYLEKKRTPDLPAMCGLHEVYKVYIPDVLNKMLWALLCFEHLYGLDRHPYATWYSMTWKSAVASYLRVVMGR